MPDARSSLTLGGIDPLARSTHTGTQVLSTISNIEQRVKIFDGALTTASQDVTITGYSWICFKWWGTSTNAAATDSLRIRFNGDATNRYSFNASALTSTISAGNIPGASGLTIQMGMVEGDFFLGGTTFATWGKVVNFGSVTTAATLSAGVPSFTSGNYNPVSLAAITSIRFLLGSAGVPTFANSRLIVEGIV